MNGARIVIGQIVKMVVLLPVRIVKIALFVLCAMVCFVLSALWNAGKRIAVTLVV
jgi:hypothetical protein